MTIYRKETMSDEIYQQLRERLDTYSLGFPPTESGVEMKILKKLFSPADAELFLEMTLGLETPEGVAGRTGRDPGVVAEKLEAMAGAGLLFRLRRQDKLRYAAVPFVIGIYEFQVKRMDRELAEMTEQYFKEAFLGTLVGSVPPLRTIPVNQSLEPSVQIASHADAREIVKNAKKIAIAPCVCRVQQDTIDAGCGKPLEACFTFGSHADFYVENGMGRYIDVAEGLDILKQCETAGLVVQPASTVNPGGMCNCCGDCCASIRSLKALNRPAEVVMNDYVAEVTKAECTSCDTCLDRCQMDAIRMDEGNMATILKERCIGCGLCVTTCPGEAIHLKLKPESERTTVPATGRDLYIKMAESRGVIPGSKP